MARPRWHLAASLGLAAVQYGRTGRLWPTVAPLISGFLIDADHLLDYALYHRAPSGQAERARRTMVLALHGWEWVLLTAVLEPMVLRGRRSTAHGLTLGYLTHLVTDQFANRLVDPLAYSLLHRASRRFEGTFFERSSYRPWRQEPLRHLWKLF